LIREIRLRWNPGIDTIFRGQNLSQPWQQELVSESMEILPSRLADALLMLSRRLASKEYGLIHLAGWGHPLLLAALLLGRMRGIPVTVESDTPMPSASPLWKGIVKRVLFPYLFKLPALFLPGGSRQAAYLRHYGVPKQRIVVAHMTVDTAAISAYIDAMDAIRRREVRTHFGIASDATVFLYVGRLEPQKGLLELISAFNQLPMPEKSQAQLLLVGDGSMRNRVLEEVERGEHITYAGRLSGTALLDAYGMADVLILPSLAEPWGLVVNEAMAAGLPVIVTDQVGCADDLVIPNKTGLVVPAGSSDGLLSAMVRLIRNRPLHDSMAHNARTMIARWNLENEAEILTLAWMKILEA
jgi:glycosyltransferase involved in cell wall biosynthesis